MSKFRKIPQVKMETSEKKVKSEKHLKENMPVKRIERKRFK